MDKEKTFPTWQNILFPFLITGFMCILLSFLFWDFRWLTVRLWIFISIVWGAICELDDHMKRRRNKKLNDAEKNK